MRSTIILLALLVVFIHAVLAEKKDKSNKQVDDQKKEASSMFEQFMKLQKARRERLRAHADKKTDGAAKKPSKRQVWFGGNGDNNGFGRNAAKQPSKRQVWFGGNGDNNGFGRNAAKQLSERRLVNIAF